MARTKPKPTVVVRSTGETISNYRILKVGDIILTDSSSNPSIPYQALIGNLYLTTLTKELYNQIKKTNLSGSSFTLTPDTGSAGYIVIRNANRVTSDRVSILSGSAPPNPTALTATEGDGLTVGVLIGTTTFGTISADWNNSASLGPIELILWNSRSGGSAGSYTPPTLGFLSFSGARSFSYFYFETADPIPKPTKTEPYIYQSAITSRNSAVRINAELPSQTVVGDLVVNAHASGTGVPDTPAGWTSISRGTVLPYYDIYYKYITDIDTDDSFTDYTFDDVLYTANIQNIGTSTFVAGTATTTFNAGTVGNQPTITSMQNTQPYQLGFFVGIQKTNLTNDLFLQATNEWNLDDSMQPFNVAGTATVSMGVATFNAIEEQVLPPSQLAYSKTFEAGGTAYSDTYPSVAVNLLVKNNQQ
jgi:hypothetical protein